MKKMISTIALLAVLLSVFTVFSEAGYADSPVAVIPDSENEQKTTGGNPPSWYSVNGYPSWDDIVAIGDGERIKSPGDHIPAPDYLHPARNVHRTDHHPLRGPGGYLLRVGKNAPAGNPCGSFLTFPFCGRSYT